MDRIIFLTLFIVFGFMFGLDEKSTTQVATKVAEEKKQPTRLESFAKLQTVISAVENYYVDDVKLNEIVDKAIAGLMSELDAHSAYMNKESYKNMQISMDGEFGGLGIVIGMRDGALTIISPIDDTPAQKAGVKAGDIILKIGDKSTLKMTIDEAVAIMRGEAGTPIDITVVRKNESAPITFHIVRDIIKVKSVNTKTYNNDILYLRVTQFDNHVAELLSKAIQDHKKETKGIILDLRNNPGGSLEQSIKTVDLFVDSGVIVSQRGKTKSEDSSFSATKQATLTKVPLVVLVNGGSASASEIVSGALQDFKRAVIVGEDTFGKGSVQMLMPITLDKSEAIKLTIAKYYLPSGRTIQAVGVKPDIKVAFGKTLTTESDKIVIKEKDLKKHLELELKKVDTTKAVEAKEPPEDETMMDEKKKTINDEDLMKDNQLKSAMDILKSLIILEK
ncbi:MAG: S41 family peptidase [Arcobacteraceae bacterium]|jgi:carboxyl-terminal processing protease|nr:S41 family peptidase [Arcobacteraceae bacterium]